METKTFLDVFEQSVDLRGGLSGRFVFVVAALNLDIELDWDAGLVVDFQQLAMLSFRFATAT